MSGLQELLGPRWPLDHDSEPADCWSRPSTGSAPPSVASLAVATKPRGERQRSGVRQLGLVPASRGNSLGTPMEYSVEPLTQHSLIPLPMMASVTGLRPSPMSSLQTATSIAGSILMAVALLAVTVSALVIFFARHQSNTGSSTGTLVSVSSLSHQPFFFSATPL